MKRSQVVLLVAAALAGCNREGEEAETSREKIQSPSALAEARKGFQTKLARRTSANEPIAPPPPNVFHVVQYDSPVGKCGAYLTPDPKDGQKHPAVIWITGGDCNTIGDVWTPQPPGNDQSAAAYRNAGIVMMFPSLRGGNKNPGVRESFLGEVDDVLAAADFLAEQDYVDPKRIYLGGHSTGGTLVLLVAECTDRFRAVVSFGPVYDVRGYPREFLHFDANDDREGKIRSPGWWLASIQSQTFVIEGTRGNVDGLREMKRTSKSSTAHFLEVRGADHFNVLGPANRLIAEKILRDDGPTLNLTLTEAELNRAFAN